MSATRWVIPDEGIEESSSSSSSDEEDEEDEARTAGQLVLDRLQGDIILEDAAGPSAAPARSKISVKLKDKDACHVCGCRGHFAGFVGATYIDCVNKPCYLCGQKGHSTATCPHRMAPELACTAAADVTRGSTLAYVHKREREGRSAGAHSVGPAPQRWTVDAAVLKLHARRVTCLEYHPTRDNLLFSGDKHGQVAVWDLDKVFERTVYSDLNKWLTNGLRFLPQGGSGNEALCATASYDGTVKLLDMEIGMAVRTLVDANPRGWETVVEQDKAGTWVTFIGLDAMPQAVVAGDSKGRVYFLDPRMESPAAVLQAHKKNTKVQSVSVNPSDPNLVLTAGNDYQARLLDARNLGSGSGGSTLGTATAGGASSVAEVTSFPHARVINAAYFSPITGRKILTTCQDNRLRVWDNFASAAPDGSADREIVHSHTFNRHLTAFKAEWDPKDVHERLACVGRYISEDYGGVALHPVDLIDTATGALVSSLADPNLTTISPVNKPHPRRDVLVSGSSRSLYMWAPEGDEAEEGEAEEAWQREELRGGSSSGGIGGGGASGSGVGGGRGGGGGKVTVQLKGSSKYIFFDADDSGKKKKAKTATAAAAGTKPAKKKGKGAKEEEEGSDEE